MFESMKYIQNSFSITFPRYTEIRRQANDFEDVLKKHFCGHYSPPQVIPVPDELDPEVPRLIFGSKHGFSQIIISQMNMTLNVIYSPDWQVDIAKGKRYLRERATVLYLLFKKIDDVPIYFSGLTTRARLSTKSTEKELLHTFQENVAEVRFGGDIHDLNIKITTIVDNKFFNNTTVQNYRTWKMEGVMLGVPRFSRNAAHECGLEIIEDFNDRYAYNEEDKYFSSADIVDEIIDKGLKQIQNIENRIQRGSNTND